MINLVKKEGTLVTKIFFILKFKGSNINDELLLFQEEAVEARLYEEAFPEESIQNVVIVYENNVIQNDVPEERYAGGGQIIVDTTIEVVLFREVRVVLDVPDGLQGAVINRISIVFYQVRNINISAIATHNF